MSDFKLENEPWWILLMEKVEEFENSEEEK